jgi:hypothetical protein
LVASEGGHDESEVPAFVSDRELTPQARPNRIDRVREYAQRLLFRRREVRGGEAPCRLVAAGVAFDHQAS